jgi:uncharacterized protein YbjT (DUF2867 family)
LIGRLLARGHSVRALVRSGSRTELPAGAEPVVGDALRSETFRTAVSASDTLVHLVGTPRPSPAKAAEFRSVDLVSVRASLSAALETGVRHFVYVSVAHPAPVMRAYIAVRSECEALIRASGLAATLLRPWYVLGPGHRWPWLLLPLYTMLRLVPATRAGVRRLGLVSRGQMVGALVHAVENPPVGVRVVEVPEIRSLGG